VSEYLTQKNVFKLKTLKELTSEVIAMKSVRSDEREAQEQHLGFLEIFPGLNQFKVGGVNGKLNKNN